VNRPHGPILWFSLIGLGAAIGLGLLPSEESKITRNLDGLADILSFENGPPKPQAAIRYHQVFPEHLTFPITLDIAELGESSHPLTELVDGYMAYSSGLISLKIRLGDVQVSLSENDDRATAKGDCYVTMQRTTGEKRTEPRRFVATFEKRKRQWFILHAKVTESRIDQPEARP
jgi:hypothetical protein